MGPLLTAALACFVTPAPADSPPATLLIEVDAGAHRRVQTPVAFALPAAFATAASIRLADAETGEPVPLQVEESRSPGKPVRSALAVVSLPAGAKRRYRLESSRDPAPHVVTVRQGEGSVTALVQGEEVWTYQLDTVDPPAGLDPIYARSGFLHPLRSPSGRVLSDDFAADHPHQHGYFFAWTNTTFRGRPINFWDQFQKTATVRNISPMPAPADPGVAPRFDFQLRHEALDAGGESSSPVLEERWSIRTFPVESPFLVDFESSQVAATEEPLIINAYHYGGIGYRGNIAWYDPTVKGENPPDPDRSGQSDFLTSDRKTRADGNHTRPKWLDLYGKVDGRFCGIAVLQHPSNFRFPQPVRLHPNKPYFSIAPAVLGPFRIEKDAPYVSRYRLVLHDGKPDPRELDRLWADYAEPPSVRVVDGDR